MKSALGARRQPMILSISTAGYINDSIYDELIEGEEDAFQVVSAGRNPPNPVELLSSAKMMDLLEKLRKTYDYVILDLPPVGEVSDALAIAKQIDGILLVVRQDYCNRMALNAAINQFEFVECRILGTVFNCTNEEGAGYGRKYYSKYGRKYYRYYRSDYGYGQSNKVKSKEQE